jgi:hypothetical protein
MAYDIENFLGNLQTCLVANLNNKIAAINTEKGDFTLDAIDTSAYRLQDLAEGPSQYNPFIVYGELEDPVGESLGSGTAIKYSVGIELAISDAGADPKIKNRLLRYRRALMEVIQDNWDRIGQLSLKVKVKSTVPSPFFKTQDFEGRSVGVTIEVWLA